MPQFLLGVNYWPSRSAMYMWQRFDLGELRDDFAHIRSLGLDVVRFFLMWDDFQPQPDAVDGGMLKRFEGVMDAIAAAGLKAMPTFFTGHMSGVNFLPDWMLDRDRPAGRFRTFGSGGREFAFGAGNFYKEPLLSALRYQVRAVGERVRGHEALYLWDLGNEFSNLRPADSPADAAFWSERLTGDLRAVSGAGCAAGTHGEDITDDRGIRPSTFCAPHECAVMHGYSVYGDLARNRLDPEIVPFFCQLWQSMAAKPVLFNEFGNPSCPPGTVSPYDRQPLPGDPPADTSSLPKNAAPYACLTEPEMAQYCTQVVERLHARGALGAFWWNWTDYASNLAQTPPFDRAPHEMTFGMVHADGSEKPVALALRTFAQKRLQVVPPPAAIVREDDWYTRRADKSYQRTMYAEYVATHETLHA